MPSDKQIITLPYGKGELTIELPGKGQPCMIIEQGEKEAIADVKAAVVARLKNPIGCPPLGETVRSKEAKTACIVVNDITRPTPTEPMLLAIAAELNENGIPDENIKVLVATGTHRANTVEEMEEMFGREALDRFTVINHDCMNDEELKYLGTTSNGIPVVVSRHFVEADIRITTGIIAPHQRAGFSGGRKSVLPGIAGLDSLKKHHGMESDGPAMGKIENNPFHQAAVEAAQFAGLDFIVNAVPRRRETVAIVAGDPMEAWLEGVSHSRDVVELKIPYKADIVITHCGGHPRDFNLYQAQKAITSAQLATKKGGTIIVLGECSDGIGSETVREWLEKASHPQEVVDRFIREGFQPGTSKAYLFAKGMLDFRMALVSDKISHETLRNMFIEPYNTLDEALEAAFSRHGSDAKMLLLRNAVEAICVLDE